MDELVGRTLLIGVRRKLPQVITAETVAVLKTIPSDQVSIENLLRVSLTLECPEAFCRALPGRKCTARVGHQLAEPHARRISRGAAVMRYLLTVPSEARFK